MHVVDDESSSEANMASSMGIGGKASKTVKKGSAGKTVSGKDIRAMGDKKVLQKKKKKQSSNEQ